MRKKSLIILVVLMFVLQGCSSNSGQPSSNGNQFKGNQSSKEKVMLTLVTSQPEGGPYPIDAATAEVIKKYLKGVQVTVQASAGGKEAIQLMKVGDAQIAGTTADVPLALDYNDEVRALFPTLIAVSHLMVPKDSSYKSVMDLKAKPVSMGEPGSGISKRGVVIRGGIGADDKFFNDKKLSIGDSADAFKNGDIDLVLNSNSIGNSAILDLAGSKRGVKFLSLPDDAIKKIVSQNPDMTKYVIPANTYQGQNYEVQTVAVPVLKVVKKDFPDELAYNIVKTVWEHFDEVRVAAPTATTPENFDKLTGNIKLHPGAEKYFREIGLIK